jgi:hypothetical protein
MRRPARGPAWVLLELKKGMTGKQGKYGTTRPLDQPGHPHNPNN